MKSQNTNGKISITFVFLMCFMFRLMEYILIQTDRGIFGEAFIHKLLGIGVLYIAVKKTGFTIAEIGFCRNKAFRQLTFGLCLGFVTFLIAYTVEFYVLALMGRAPHLGLYISSYSITGNRMMDSGLLLLVLCITGNVINVIMEEGIFRGLFFKIQEERKGLLSAVVLTSFLFGLWHTAAPLRAMIEGQLGFGGLLGASLMQLILTGVGGIKFCMLVKVSNSLWMAMADHFFNNFISNVLHVTTISGADEMQVIRISIAQTISFLFVLILLIIKKRRKARHHEITE